MRVGVIAVLAGAGAAVAYLRDARRRNEARDRALSLARRGQSRTQGTAEHAANLAQGSAMQATSPVRQEQRDYDDVTLARKVESEIFRPAEMNELKGHVSVSVADGVVELRGEVQSPDQVSALGAAAQAVAGVRGVHNLLHTPGSPPGHSPPSSPKEVRERAEHEAGSRFAGNPATRPPADEPMVGRADAPSASDSS